MGIIRSDPNAKYLAANLVTDMAGPDAAGLIGSIVQGFNATALAMNPWSVEYAFTLEEDENRRKALEAGFDVPTLDTIQVGNAGAMPLREFIDSRSSEDVLRYYTDFQRAAYAADTFAANYAYGQDVRAANVRDIIGERDKLILEARKARPDLNILTYEEMRQKVLRTARETYDTYAYGRNGVGTAIGSFVGEAAGTFHGSNPLWPLQFLGGGGKTVGTRVLGQFTAGATTEAINQLTGTDETMRWLGIEQTPGQKLLQIGLAGVLPAGVQGLGEGVARFARRRAAPPPSPRPSPVSAPPVTLPERPAARTAPMASAGVASERIPVAREIMDSLGLSAMERPRFALDVDHASRNSDTFGTSPGDMHPPTVGLKDGASVIPNYKEWLGPGAENQNARPPATWDAPAARIGEPDMNEVARGEWGAGRAVDPEVFSKLDKLDKDIADINERLALAAALAAERDAGTAFGSLGEIRGRKGNARTNAATQRVLQENIEAGARVKGESGVARVAKRGEAIRKMQEGKGPVIAEFDPVRLTAKLAALRQARGELLPLAERAEARARGLWELGASELPKAWHEAVAASAANHAQAEKRSRIPRWLSHPNVVKRLSEMEPTFPEFHHPAAALGRQRNEPKIDTIQRVQDAMAKENEAVDESQVGVLDKLAKEADELKANPPKEKPPEPPEPDPLDEHRAMLEAVGDKEIPIDGRTLTVRDFLKAMDEEKQAIGDVTACHTMMGWSSGSES